MASSSAAPVQIPLILRLTGAEVAEDAALEGAILSLDRANMQPIMDAAAFINFPWDRRIQGLLDPDTIIHYAFCGDAMAGYLELHPRRLGGGVVYISSCQIVPAYRGTRLFLRLLMAAAAWLREDAASTGVTTEVQVVNVRMNAILEKLGFTFRDGKHAHTRHASISRETLLESRLLRG